MKLLKKISPICIVFFLFANSTFAQVPITKNQVSVEKLLAISATDLNNDSMEKIRKDEIILQEEKNRIASLKKNLKMNSTKNNPMDEVLSPEAIAKKKAHIQQRERKLQALESALQSRKQRLSGTKED